MSVLERMGLSEQQRAALVDERPEVLVAAGAGSGKTKLLVAAVVRALVEEGLPLERLIAVTFTRKAGAELASRVRVALEECGRSDLARMLDSAALGTIDSLCRHLIKDQALAAGVDPACGVLEAEAADLVKREIAASSWERVVERADEALLDILATSGKDLRSEVVSLYDRLRGLGQDEPHVAVDGGVPEEESRAELADKVREALDAGTSDGRPTTSLGDDLDRLRACLEWLQGPAAGREEEAGLRESEGFFPSRRTKRMEEYFLPVRAALSRYRCALAEARLRPLAEAADLLLSEFHSRYTSWKEEHGLVDFTDLELKTRKLVSRSEHGQPGPRLLDGAFLLVDEFQDTNELQWSILSRLGAERVLLVGDERQSIYRFRGADVEVFRRRRKALAGNKAGGSPGGLHRLDANYRSRPEVLGFVNRLFSHEDFFGRGFARLTPGRAQQAIGGEPASGQELQTCRARVCAEVLVAERREDERGEGQLVSASQAEAEALAARVRSMVDKEGWRQRDIVVLLPTQTQVDKYRDALVDQGVDVYLVRGRGYYGREEVTDVSSLLRVLVNPHDDLALLAVLRSPLVGLSDDGLYLLGRERRARRAGSLWEVLRGEDVVELGVDDQQALRLLGDRLEYFRPRVGRAGLARLIDEICTSLAYDLCLLAAPDGRRRFANVRKLMRLAEEYETSNGPDLAGFLAVLRTMGRLSDREGSAPTLAEGEDVVRIMTIHQAKGLEFPVVALVGLGADAYQPRTSLFAVGGDGRLGLFLKGHRQRTYESHDPCWGPAVEIATEESEREREEDVRLLYVAMTRAEEQLLLVGAKPTREGMEGTRIGRILTALGIASFPAAGEECAVAGTEALVYGVASGAVVGGSADGYGSAAADGARLSRVQAAAPAPQLLDLPSAMAVPTRVSFSALAAYQRCPRRFYLERVLGLDLQGTAPADQADGDDRGGLPLLDQEEASAGRDVGILVHHLLEKMAVGETRPASDRIRRAAEGALSDMGIRLQPDDVDRAIDLTSAVWDSALATRLTSPAAMREAPFYFVSDGTMVSGVMDFVCPDPECWWVVDYKTNALRGRKVSELAKEYTLQSRLYGLAALRAGAPAVRMDLLFLERPAEPASSTYRSEEAGDLQKSLDEVLAGLRRREFPLVTGRACGGCPVRAVCDNMARA